MTENPFFESWTTPFGMPPFDRIRPEHFPPAFDRGMHEQVAEIAAFTSSAAPPSFADTIEALERSGRLLERVSRVFFNLDSSNTNDAIEAIARDYAPRLAQHQIRIALARERGPAGSSRRASMVGLVVGMRRDAGVFGRSYRIAVQAGDKAMAKRLWADSFRVKRAIFERLSPGDRITVEYSPRLFYVYNMVLPEPLKKAVG